MILNPIDDRLVIELSPKEERTPSGILLPENSSVGTVARGTVVAVGPGYRFDGDKFAPLSVKVGDEVAFGRYAGSEIVVGGKKQVVCKEMEVLCIIKGA